MILALCFYGGSAFGEEIPVGQPPVPENVTPAMAAIPAKEGYIDRSHAYFDRKINHVVTWFDGLFGDTDQHDSKKAEIKLQWTNELRAEEGKTIRYRTALHAQLHLPRLENRFRLVIMQETRQE